MNDRTIALDRRSYVKATGLSLAGVAGCLGSESGTLATHVTDQPGDISDFDSCVVTIVGIWLGPKDAETADPSGREHHEFADPQDADLVELQGDETQLIDERELSPAAYEFLQLDVDGIDATLEGGDAATVETPGNAPLTFNEPFEIREGTRTSFTADFTPVQRGATGRYVLQPVARGIEVEYAEA